MKIWNFYIYFTKYRISIYFVQNIEFLYTLYKNIEFLYTLYKNIEFLYSLYKNIKFIYILYKNIEFLYILYKKLNFYIFCTMFTFSQYNEESDHHLLSILVIYFVQKYNISINFVQTYWFFKHFVQRYRNSIKYVQI